MPPIIARSKSTNQRKESPASQTSGVSHRNRAKNYSKDECDILVNLCSKAHNIINKNSNSEVDKKLKDAARANIKTQFDIQCKAEGIFVQDRTIDQLQSKYKDLMKNARQVVSKVKRDIVKTGNKPLQSRTTRALSVDSYSMLQGLRKQMRPTATGFDSKYDSDAQYAKDRSQNKEPSSGGYLEGSDSKSSDQRAHFVTEFGEPVLGQSSNYTPRPILNRKRREFAGSIDSQTIVIGSDDTSNDFTDGNVDEEYEPFNSNRENETTPNPRNEIAIEAFTNLAKKLEAERLENLLLEERVQLSDVVDSDLEMIDNPNVETIDSQFPINRYLLSQYEQYMQDAGTSAPLSDPPPKKRPTKRAAKSAPAESNALVDELRTKQLALVHKQLELHKILQETALINREAASVAKEEAMERIALLKVQQQIAKMELEEKRKNSNS